MYGYLNCVETKNHYFLEFFYHTRTYTDPLSPAKKKYWNTQLSCTAQDKGGLGPRGVLFGRGFIMSHLLIT